VQSGSEQGPWHGRTSQEIFRKRLAGPFPCSFMPEAFSLTFLSPVPRKCEQCCSCWVTKGSTSVLGYQQTHPSSSRAHGVLAWSFQGAVALGAHNCLERPPKPGQPCESCAKRWTVMVHTRPQPRHPPPDLLRDEHQRFHGRGGSAARCWQRYGAAGGFLAWHGGILVHEEGRALFIESLTSLPSSPARYSERSLRQVLT